MIGVIGSGDSVTLAMRVAQEIGLADRVISRSYASIDEVPAIARDLDALCRVLLFTGRAPYAMALALDPSLRATLDFVPHSAIDLYRTLALVMRSSGGIVPAFVVDTIDRSVVEEVCQDLGLDAPVQVLSLDTATGALRDPDEIIGSHVAAQQSGRAALSLTCLGAVGQGLLGLGIPVRRIEHTRSTLHHALIRASLTVRKYEAEGSKASVLLLRPAKSGRSSEDVPDLEGYAQRLRGALRRTPDGIWCIHTTYGVLEALLRSGDTGIPSDWAAGFGVGATPADAEDNARRALQLSRPGRGLATVLADGSVIGIEAQGAMSYRLRETDGQMLAHARGVGLRSLTLARLAVALRDLDAESFTVSELAQAYGVEPRSALRLLSRLEDAGIATVRGVDGSPGAGRPRRVYSVDLDRLVPSRSQTAT